MTRARNLLSTIQVNAYVTGAASNVLQLVR